MDQKHVLRQMTEADLQRLLKWRNHPDVSRYMYSRQRIRMDEHCAWFANAKQNRDVTLLIYERDGEPSGFVNITRTRCRNVADWGFYLAPNAPQGSGRHLGTQALNFAFTQLDLHKVCGQALKFNQRSIAFHIRLGFTKEGHLRAQHFDGNKFHDVMCFGILRTEWQSLKKMGYK